MTLDQTTTLTLIALRRGESLLQELAATRRGPDDPVILEVRGKIVWLSGSPKGVGDTSLTNNGQITSAKIGGGCCELASTERRTPCLDFTAATTSTSSPAATARLRTAITAPALTNNGFRRTITRPRTSGRGEPLQPGPNGSTRLAIRASTTTRLREQHRRDLQRRRLRPDPSSSYTCETTVERARSLRSSLEHDDADPGRSGAPSSSTATCRYRRDRQVPAA